MLELLYCYECGDISLGGYVVKADIPDATFLASTPPDVQTERAGPVFKRSHYEYRWYRPGVLSTDVSWSPTTPGGAKHEIGFRSVRYDPKLGAVLPADGQATGMVVSGFPELEDLAPASLPVRCPRCEQQAGQVNGTEYYASEIRSPIRAHTSGLAQSTQLVMSQLHRSMSAGPEHVDEDLRQQEQIKRSRTIVFTDSRDDAARTASGAELNHFRDLIRQLVRQDFQNTLDLSSSDIDDLMRRGVADPDGLSPDELTRFEDLKERDKVAALSYRLDATGNADDDDREVIARFLEEHGGSGGTILWDVLVRRVRDELITLGLNPAGPEYSMQTIEGSGDQPWYRAHLPPSSGA